MVPFRLSYKANYLIVNCKMFIQKVINLYVFLSFTIQKEKKKHQFLKDLVFPKRNERENIIYVNVNANKLFIIILYLFTIINNFPIVEYLL